MANRCMNKSDEFVDDSLKGIYRANKGFYSYADGDLRALYHQGAKTRRVGIVTGGGYGHLPVFLGYVGDGLCDGCAVGNVFTSPSCDTILNVSRKAAKEDGLLYLFGNYFGDTMNFEMAGEILAAEGIRTQIVKAADDIASAPKNEREARRGIAGLTLLYKIAGACADLGYSMDDLLKIVNRANERLSTFGVAFSSCTLPGSEGPIFEMDADDMEIGMGIHGEPGISRGRMLPANGIGQELAPKLLEDQNIQPGDRIAVMVNGLGSTSREELYILYPSVAECLEGSGALITKTYVGEYATSLEMAGLSVSILKLDDQLEKLLDQPSYTPFISF